MQSICLFVLAAIVIVLAVFSNAEPYQGYRAYRSPLREGTFDHTSLLRFSDSPSTIGSASAAQPRFGLTVRDYVYPQMKYGSSSPMYVFDGRLYNLASPRS